MNVDEIPLAIDCAGDTLIGIIHRPAQPLTRGVLTLVAGGPQYRAGCCRQLVHIARDFSAHGIPVMRFDHRGVGDGSGDFMGFQHVGADLAAAITAFKHNVPELREIVLWGGCDAASGILIHAAHLIDVTQLIISNPYAHTDSTQAVVTRQHYLRRLRERSFWIKVLKLRFNPLIYVRSGFSKTVRRLARTGGASQAGQLRPFTERMLLGLKAFKGKTLLLMSGQSVTSEEFDVLAASSTDWRNAIQTPALSRVNLTRADQVFSTPEARGEMIHVTREWLLYGTVSASTA